MKKTILIFCSCFIFLTMHCNSFAQKNQYSVTAVKPVVSPKVKIADWFGFSKAAYSISLDDGLFSHYKYAAPSLDKYNLKATFYIVSENLQSDSLSSPIWRYGYWYQFIELYKKGHEIGSHSATHPKLTTLSDGNPKAIGTLQNELQSPIKTLQKKIPGYQPVTFAYPFVDFNEHVMTETSKLYISSRGLGSGFNTAHPSEWMNLQAHTISYNSTRTLPSDIEQIISLETWITNNTIAKKGWSIFLAHDVLPFQEVLTATDSWHPVSLESFDSFAQWLSEKQKSKELWVATVADVTRYIKEREATSVIITRENSEKISLAISDTLDNNLYNIPLTLEIEIPSNWKKVSVSQKNIKINSEFINGKLIFNAIPDQGDIEISKAE